MRVTNLWAQDDCETIWAAANDGALRVWSGAEGRALRYLRGHEDSVTVLEGIGGIGGLYGTTSCLVGTGSVDRTVRVWDCRAKRAQVFLFKGHSDTITALRWGEGGRSVVSAGKDKAIRIWDTRAGRLRVALEKHYSAVTALRAIPEELQCSALKLGAGAEGASYISGGKDSMANLWTASGDCVGSQVAHRGTVGFFSDINCSLNYRGMAGQPVMFSLGSDSMVRLWDLRRFRPVGEISLGHTCNKGVWAGQSLVTAGANGAVTCWGYGNVMEGTRDGLGPLWRDVGAGAGAGTSLGDVGAGGAGSGVGWRGRQLSSHAAAATEIISTPNFVATGAKNGQLLVWSGSD